MIELMIYTSLFIVGLKLITQQGMIFSEVGRRIELLSRQKRYEKALMPLFTCVYCMASVWGLASYLLFYKLTVYSLIEIPVFCVGLVTLNGFFYNLSNFES